MAGDSTIHGAMNDKGHANNTTTEDHNGSNDMTDEQSTNEIEMLEITHNSASTDEDSETDLINDSVLNESEMNQSTISKYQSRNETSVRCFHVRDMHVSSCMVIAVASDRGVHIFIPRYLCTGSVRNAIYRQILILSPMAELREHLSNKITHSYASISSFSNFTLVRSVRWAPFGLYLAALTNDFQLILSKADLSRNSSDQFPSLNISLLLLDKFSSIPNPKTTFANNAVVRRSVEYGEISHFAWAEMTFKHYATKPTIEIALVNKKYQLLIVSLEMEAMRVKTKLCCELKSVPCLLLCSHYPEKASIKVVVGYTNGSVEILTLSLSFEVQNSLKIETNGLVDFVPILCGAFCPESEIVCLVKYNRLIFLSTTSFSSNSSKYCVEIELPEDHNVYRVKFSENTLMYFTKSGVIAFCQIDKSFFRPEKSSELKEKILTSLQRELLVIESKYPKYINGAKAEQNINSIDVSTNLEFVFYVYEDGFVPKREKRDFKLVCLSTNSDLHKFGGSKLELDCFNSDFLFNEQWYTNTYFMDTKCFVQKYWLDKSKMISLSNGVKFGAESISNACPLCDKSIINLSPDLIGYCPEGDDWPICCKGHIIKKTIDVVTCLMCRMIYCFVHKPGSCLYCKMPIF